MKIRRKDKRGSRRGMKEGYSKEIRKCCMGALCCSY
jgi:hypothetical protein